MNNVRCRKRLATFAALLLLIVWSRASSLEIDFSQSTGSIRALHGANGGPLCYRGVVDLSAYHAELGFPLLRLHDVPWANYDAVDISALFPDFRNDATQAENYDFAITDDYLAAIAKNGTPILYRLGESIEHTPRKYRVNPPRDFQKWAEISCGVIRHYNDGWAGGFKYNIRYWEIWNEPDNKPAMWTGTDEQFLELFALTAKALKSRWPELKVGGPGLANAGSLQSGEFKPSAYLLRFLQHCRSNNVPLDFLSWHRYTKDPAEYAIRVRGVRQILDSYGFTQTESHLNEWNYLPKGDWTSLTKRGQGTMRDQWLGEMHGPSGAAFVAWVLMSLQDQPVEMANFFTADNQMLGIFNVNGVPEKNFYAFKAFKTLFSTPLRVKTPACSSGSLAFCAGLSPQKTQAAILASAFYPTQDPPQLILRNLPWKGNSRYELLVLDSQRNLDVARSGTLNSSDAFPLPELKPPSVALLRLSPQ